LEYQWFVIFFPCFIRKYEKARKTTKDKTQAEYLKKEKWNSALTLMKHIKIKLIPLIVCRPTEKKKKKRKE